MAMTKVATAGFSSVTLPATQTVSFAGGATAVAGRLLIAGVSVSSAASAWAASMPSGWQPLSSVAAGTTNMKAAWFWKIADGSETGASISWSSSGSFGSLFVAEFDDAITGSPTVAENEGGVSSAATSASSGTASSSFAAGLAVAFFAADYSANVNASRAYSNGFAEQFFYDNTLSRSSTAMATKAVSGTGDYETTFSCIDTGDELYGAIALFEAAGGGETPAPTSSAMAGVAVLSAAPRALARTAAALAGAGSLAGTAQGAARAALALSGSASLAAAAQAAARAAATLSGSSSLDAVARARALTAAALAGTSTMAIALGTTDLVPTAARTFSSAGQSRTYSRGGSPRIFVLDRRQRTFP